MISVAYEMTTINMDMFAVFKLVAKAVVGGFMCDRKAPSCFRVAFAYSDA